MPSGLPTVAPVSPYQKYKLARKKHPTWTRVLAEGDSWFDFPNYQPQPRLDVINWLRTDTFKYVVCNYAVMGDTIAHMVEEGEYVRVLSRRSGDRFADDFACFLVSGGGNDVLGKPLAELARKPTPTRPDLVNRDKLKIVMMRLESYYRDLHHRVQAIRPGLPVVVHGYDYAIPSGAAVKFFWSFKVAGPWMKPTLESLGITDGGHQREVIRILIQAINRMHRKLAGALEHYVHVDCRDTLGDADWGDEIHPTSDGFRKIAEKIDATIQAL